MKKKNKLVVLLVLLIILIAICKKVLIFESITYKVRTNDIKVKIKETYKENYYIELKTENNTYVFRIYENLRKSRKIVKDIYFYKDNSIECVLPIINDNVYTDVMCYKDEILYNYHSIIEENNKLDEFVSSIELYNPENYKNIPYQTKKIGSIKYNSYKNLKKSMAITTYKGIIINGEEIKLFEDDIYINKISSFINNYYLVADYNNKYSFNYFYIVNLNTKEVYTLKSKENISFDSYIQGIVDNKIYLYDKDNETQYKIDVENKKVDIVSSDKYIKYYNNKKWERINKTKANKEITFNYQTLDNQFTKYDYVKETTDNYYLFKKDGISYKLYKLDKNNIDVSKYILNVPVTNVYLNDDYLYYVYKDKLYYYSDNTGLKTIFENSELEFNNTIKYYIY